MLDDILSQVQKPARYIGGEWNLPKKDFDKSYIKFALCFPDLYEVGMSNLGIRIIYSILNSIPDVSCERFFSCGLDMEQILRSRNSEILSLESKKRLSEFDIIGFSLASELNYTNALNILELGGIPLKSSLRANREPLVIAGGPSTLNPEPMHEFFDMFFIGEGEDLILEFIELYREYKDKYKRSEVSKQDLLFTFLNIPGVYVPSFYKVRYNSTGAIEEFKPEIEGVKLKVTKRFVKDLNSSYFPYVWLLPYIQTVHDRITLEIMRGCPNRCRFCQAKSAYFPLRFRGIENILNLARQTYERTGYEEISLAGLSVSDYTNIDELLQGLNDLFKDKAVGVALPSLKAKAGVGGLSSLIAKVKKTGLTFAPESGSRRLRQILGKDFNEEDFFNTVEQAYAAGYRHLKLYFMIGLPSEEEKDLNDIVEFAIRTSELRKRIKKVPAQVNPALPCKDHKLNNSKGWVNISINALIPKPHTPLQWFGMLDVEGIKYKQDYLRNKIRNKRLALSFHNRYMSFLEGVLSRGDRRLSEVIFSAFKNGARFDGWGDGFAFEKWLAAFAGANIDPHFYLKEKSQDELLPWDFIDVGIPKGALIEEFNKVVDIK